MFSGAYFAFSESQSSPQQPAMFANSAPTMTQGSRGSQTNATSLGEMRAFVLTAVVTLGTVAVAGMLAARIYTQLSQLSAWDAVRTLGGLP